MPHENYAAKQQRIGERLTRAMAKAHMNRNELAELTGYSVEQIVSWERGRARIQPSPGATNSRPPTFRRSPRSWQTAPQPRPRVISLNRQHSHDHHRCKIHSTASRGRSTD
jgi:DNA-binding XRE family transcriptional regulator